MRDSANVYPNISCFAVCHCPSLVIDHRTSYCKSSESDVRVMPSSGGPFTYATVKIT